MKASATAVSRVSPQATRSQKEERFVCPSCRGALLRKGAGWKCTKESLLFGAIAGIPDFVVPARKERVARFLKIYQNIRNLEEWGDGSAGFVLGLPFADGTGKHADNWRVRAKTYNSFMSVLEGAVPTSGRVLDLGAGNCWLSVRLMKRGYRVTAVDVNLDERDGLQAAQSPQIPPIELVRAEFDRLPFPAASFDVIVFNASLHYANDPLLTLRTISPFLAQGGFIYVLDSPVYDREEDGHAMLRERAEKIGGLIGQVIPAELRGSFLTNDSIHQLETEFEVSILRPKYGLLWNLRPAVAFVFRRRQPAEFLITRLRPRAGSPSE